MVQKIKGGTLKTLAHFIDKEWLVESWKRLNKRSAAGLDRVSAKQYGDNLDNNIDQLLEKMRTGKYRSSPLRRVYIPKDNGKKRSLGLPTIQDKLAQQAVSLILTEVYEPEFLPMSYGYRPGRTTHDALNAVKASVAKGKVSWVVDTDIRPFFDEMSHEWLLKFLRHRIEDKNILRLIRKWLKAGVLEEGKVKRTSTGTPQGGVISPILANIYLHYVVDLWATKVVPKHIKGEMYSVRYADDCLFCFQRLDDAVRFKKALTNRLAKFKLSLNESKSKLCRFGRFAETNRKRIGEKRQTIQFLGFTLYNKLSRKGKYTVGCRTASKKLCTEMNHVTTWCKQHRHQRIEWQARYLNAVLRGHYHYYGVTHNYPSINAFYRHVQWAWHRFLSRRSQRARISWEKFYKLLEKYPLEKPHLPKAAHW
jgi:group II intron reverse transcriptase/maturase